MKEVMQIDKGKWVEVKPVEMPTYVFPKHCYNNATGESKDVDASLDCSSLNGNALGSDPSAPRRGKEAQ
jgi:hypothetical protein